MKQSYISFNLSNGQTIKFKDYTYEGDYEGKRIESDFNDLLSRIESGDALLSFPSSASSNEITTLTFTNDTLNNNTNYDGKYFDIYDLESKYRVWYNITDLYSWKMYDDTEFGTSIDISSLNTVIDSNDNVYIAFIEEEGIYANYITTMKWDGSSWSFLGNRGTISKEADYIDMTINSSDEIFISFRDNENGLKISVITYNSGTSSWEYVGSAGFGAGNAPETAVGVNSSGNPIVAYRNSGDSSKIYVEEFDGSSWSVIGAGISDGIANSPSIKSDSAGNIYVVYKDTGAATGGGKATCKVWDGSSWSIVGEAVFTSEAVSSVSMDIDSSDNIYVSAAETGGYIYKWDGSSWSTLGPSYGSGTNYNLAINSSDEIYVCYASSGKGTVKKWDAVNTEWDTIGSSQFTNTFEGELSFYINDNDITSFFIENVGGGIEVYYYDSGSTEPAAGGGILIKIDILQSSDEDSIANLTATQLNTLDGFSCTDSTSPIEITHTSVGDATDTDTSEISVISSESSSGGTYDEYLTKSNFDSTNGNIYTTIKTSSINTIKITENELSSEWYE